MLTWGRNISHHGHRSNVSSAESRSQSLVELTESRVLLFEGIFSRARATPAHYEAPEAVAGALRSPAAELRN